MMKSQSRSSFSTSKLDAASEVEGLDSCRVLQEVIVTETINTICMLMNCNCLYSEDLK